MGREGVWWHWGHGIDAVYLWGERGVWACCLKLAASWGVGADRAAMILGEQGGCTASVAFHNGEARSLAPMLSHTA